MLVAIYGTAVVGSGWPGVAGLEILLTQRLRPLGFALDLAKAIWRGSRLSTMAIIDGKLSNESKFQIPKARGGHDAGQDRGAWQIGSWRFGVNSSDVSGCLLARNAKFWARLP